MAVNQTGIDHGNKKDGSANKNSIDSLIHFRLG